MAVIERPAPLTPFDERAAQIRADIHKPSVRAAFDKAIDGVDRDALAALQSRHEDRVHSGKPAGWHKYLDLPLWLRHHAEIFCGLGLDQAGPRDILDIGSGGCHFLRLCKVHGHRAIGLDLSWPPLYRELATLFGVERIEQGIFLDDNLPERLGRYDLIAIHAQNFDWDIKLQRYWKLEEWAGFLEQLTADHMILPGRLSMILNRRPDGEGGHDHFRPLLDLARAHGAAIGPRPSRILFSLDKPLEFSELDAKW